MRINVNFIKSSLLVFGSLALLTNFGCSKKESKDDPAPVVVQTTISNVQLIGSGIAQVSYSSNINSAEFLCKSDVNGQPGTWQSCPTGSQSVQIQGQSHVFFVKAVLGTVEDTSPASSDLGLLLTSSTQQSGANLVTVIKDKASISPVYTKRKLRVEFDLQNAGQMNPNDIRFECKGGSEVDFRPCQDASGNGKAYEFATLNNGASYSLSVRAAHIPSGQKGLEEVLTFKVDLSGASQLQVSGAEDLEKGVSRSSYPIKIDRSLAQSFTCTLDNNALDCSNGQFVFNPSAMGITSGNHVISIVGMGPSGEEVAYRDINFCVGQNCESSGADIPVTNQPLALGTFFDFTIFPGLHLEAYSSTKTRNGDLEYFFVANQNAMNSGCVSRRYEVIPLRSPGNEVLEYCHGTMTRDEYKAMNDYRFANNHIEVLTDSGIEDQVYILAQAYDSDIEFMNSQTLFKNHCQNRPIEVVQQVPLFQDWIWDRAVRGTMYKCDAYLSGSIATGLQMEEWKVVGVFLAEGDKLPDIYSGTQCNNSVSPCSFKYPKAIEIVYMETASRANSFDDRFFARAKAAINSAVFKHTPN